MRDLLDPRIARSGDITMLVSRIGPAAFPTAAKRNCPSVELRWHGLVRLERPTGWVVVDPDDVVAVVWNDDTEISPGQFLGAGRPCGKPARRFRTSCRLPLSSHHTS